MNKLFNHKHFVTLIEWFLIFCGAFTLASMINLALGGLS